MNKKVWTAMLGLLCMGVALLPACSKKEAPSEAQPTAGAPAPAATPIDPSTVASVSGTVKLDGAAPKPAKIIGRRSVDLIEASSARCIKGRIDSCNRLIV